MKNPLADKVFGGALHSRKQGMQWRAVVRVKTWTALYEAVAKAGFSETKRYLRGWWCTTGNLIEMEAAQNFKLGVVLIRPANQWDVDYRPSRKGDT